MAAVGNDAGSQQFSGRQHRHGRMSLSGAQKSKFPHAETLQPLQRVYSEQVAKVISCATLLLQGRYKLAAERDVRPAGA